MWYIYCPRLTKFALYWYQNLLLLRKGTQTLPLGHWLQRFFSLRNRCAAYSPVVWPRHYLNHTTDLDMTCQYMPVIWPSKAIPPGAKKVQVNDDSINDNTPQRKLLKDLWVSSNTMGIICCSYSLWILGMFFDASIFDPNFIGSIPSMSSCEAILELLSFT